MFVTQNTYTVKALLPSGQVLNITNALIQLAWQEQADEIAGRATLNLAQVKTEFGYLHALLPLCTNILIFGNGEEVFHGLVWEWNYNSDTQSQNIELTCYDPFIYAQNSDFYAYYPAGKSTKDLISDICSKNGIPLRYEYDSITHAKIKCDPSPIADHILDILKEAERKLPIAPVALYDKNTLVIRKKGANKTVYSFAARTSAISTSERLTLSGLVTKVSVLGKENKDGRRNIEATGLGKTQFGTLQRYVYHDGNDTLEKANQDAQKILDDKGKPERLMTLTAPDVPMVRKGDQIEVSAGSLLGTFFVKGISHNATARTMSMELEYTT
ncbi:MAG: hypothetical protein RR053_08495 [Evtepia sp.]